MKLSERDARHFFKIVMPLFGWINKNSYYLREITGGDTLVFPQDGILLWRVIRTRPEIIDEYLEDNHIKSTSDAAKTLTQWKEHFVPGPFLVERYTRKGTVFISVKTGQVYLVSGISDDFRDYLKDFELPCLIETSIMPFRDRIISEGLMAAKKAGCEPEIKAALAKRYEEAHKSNSLISKLPAEQLPDVDEHWPAELRRIASSLNMVGIDDTDEDDDTIDKAEAEIINKIKNLNLITTAESLELKMLLEPLFRTEAQWDRVKEILLDKDVITATPIDKTGAATETESLKSVDGILCYRKHLYIFSSFKKCQEFQTRLRTEDKIQHDMYSLSSFKFTDAVDITDEHKMECFLDYPDKEHFMEKFIAYNSKDKKIHASIRVAW